MVPSRAQSQRIYAPVYANDDELEAMLEADIIRIVWPCTAKWKWFGPAVYNPESHAE